MRACVRATGALLLRLGQPLRSTRSAASTAREHRCARWWRWWWWSPLARAVALPPRTKTPDSAPPPPALPPPSPASPRPLTLPPTPPPYLPTSPPPPWAGAVHVQPSAHPAWICLPVLDPPSAGCGHLNPNGPLTRLCYRPHPAGLLPGWVGGRRAGGWVGGWVLVGWSAPSRCPLSPSCSHPPPPAPSLPLTPRPPLTPPPGGQASNVATFVARGDVALSVLMTTASTMAAAVMTPTLTALLAGQFVPVNAWVRAWGRARSCGGGAGVGRVGVRPPGALVPPHSLAPP